MRTSLELAAAMAILVSCAIAGSEELTIENATKSLRARQQRFDSARFTCRRDTVFRLYDHTGKSQGGEKPSRESLLEMKDRSFSLVFSKDMVKCEEPQFDIKQDNTASVIDYLRSFDGDLQYSLSPVDQKGMRAGGIGQRGYSDGIDNVHLRGIFLALRPLQPTLISIDDGTWALDDKPGSINGTTAVALRQTPRRLGQSGTSAKVVWLDPSREFVPILYERYVGDTIKATVDIRYQLDPAHGLLPLEWESKFYGGDGALAERSINHVVDYQIGIELPKSEFQIKFPTGTVITDKRNGGKQSIVLDDGTWVPFVPGAKSAVAQGGGWGRILFFCVINVLFALLLGGLWYRRYVASRNRGDFGDGVPE